MQSPTRTATKFLAVAVYFAIRKCGNLNSPEIGSLHPQSNEQKKARRGAQALVSKMRAAPRGRKAWNTTTILPGLFPDFRRCKIRTQPRRVAATRR